MTLPFATGTYALLRGNATDVYADDSDASTAVSGYQAMVGAVVEQDAQASNRVGGMPRVIRTHTGRFPAAVPFAADDRLKDNRTGAIYMINKVQVIANPITGPTARLDLTIIT